MITRTTLVSFFFFLLWLPLSAKEVPPPPNTLVSDYIGLLQPQERAALERKLVAYNDTTSTQIAVVIEESLEGDDLFDYTLRMVEEWGIGQEGKDNGILLYIAYRDRKIIIQTGYGAEGFLPDAIAKRIIENVLKPAFRQERYYAGIDKATSIIMDLGSGEYTYDGEGSGEKEGIPLMAVLIIAIVIIIVFKSLFNDDDDDGGYYRGGRYDGRGRRGGGWIFIPGLGGGGGGGSWGGGGGGGFGGFGGGGFGGGGASGSW